MDVIKQYSGIGGGIQTPDRLIIHSMSEIISGMHASEFLQSIGLSAHFLLCLWYFVTNSLASFKDKGITFKFFAISSV